MKTGKLISNPFPTYHNKNDKNSYIRVTFLKNTWNTVGKFCHTRLQEPSLMNNSYFGALEIGLHNKQKFSRNVTIKTRNASSLM